MGIFSIARSTKCCTPRLRFLAYRKAQTPPTIAMSRIQPLLCTKFDMSMTIRVKAGRSAPKPLNRDSNCGITKISRIVVTTIATATTAAG